MTKKDVISMEKRNSIMYITETISFELLKANCNRREALELLTNVKLYCDVMIKRISSTEIVAPYYNL